MLNFLFLVPEYSVKNYYKFLQRILFCLEELIIFFLPGIIWFYYGIEETKCKSPLDKDISLMVIFYFIGALLLFIPAITTYLNKFSTFYYVKYMIFFILLES